MKTNSQTPEKKVRVLRPQFGPQEKFLATSADICVYGGAAGGGKTYGVQFLQLRRMVIVPIHCSGEIEMGGGSTKNSQCVVPVASEAVLGGVKVRPGSGLKLEPDGTLSVDTEET